MKKIKSSPRFRRFGFWSGIILGTLGMVYLGLIVALIVSGSGIPPVEPFQTVFNILIIITAAWMVFYWSILHQVAPVGSKPFSQASLSMIVIFAALTSINRYVGVTIVRQSIASGNTLDLQWFLPYGWPSVMLALEFLAWGFFFGLACFFLVPIFIGGDRLEFAIVWTLLTTGVLSLLALLGQVIGSNSPDFSLFTLIGVIAWGPGLTATAFLISIWFRRREKVKVAPIHPDSEDSSDDGGVLFLNEL